MDINIINIRTILAFIKLVNIEVSPMSNDIYNYNVHNIQDISSMRIYIANRLETRESLMSIVSTSDNNSSDKLLLMIVKDLEHMDIQLEMLNTNVTQMIENNIILLPLTSITYYSNSKILNTYIIFKPFESDNINQIAINNIINNVDVYNTHVYSSDHSRLVKAKYKYYLNMGNIISQLGVYCTLLLYILSKREKSKVTDYIVISKSEDIIIFCAYDIHNKYKYL